MACDLGLLSPEQEVKTARWMSVVVREAAERDEERLFGSEKQKRPLIAVFLIFIGGDKGSRTPDLLNAIETLYQLSYIPMIVLMLGRENGI